jgi:hypothetical protein
MLNKIFSECLLQIISFLRVQSQENQRYVWSIVAEKSCTFFFLRHSWPWIKRYSCLYLLSAEITGMLHYAQLRILNYKEKKPLKAYRMEYTDNPPTNSVMLMTITKIIWIWLKINNEGCISFILCFYKIFI